MNTESKMIAEKITELAARWEAIEKIGYEVAVDVHGQDDSNITPKGREIGYALGFSASGFANDFRPFRGRAAELRREAEEVLQYGALSCICTRGMLYKAEAEKMMDGLTPDQIAMLLVGSIVGNLKRAEEIAIS
jgi:hypothetical protein